MPGEHHTVNVDERKVLAVRLTETVIMAIVAAAVSVFATQQVLSTKMQLMETSINDLKTEIRQMRQDLYAPRVGGAQAYSADREIPAQYMPAGDTR